VSTYREIADVEKMLAGVECHTDAVVMGGGLLGLEAACGLQRCGMAVTVVHLMPTLMERQLDAGASTLLQRELIRSGVTVLTGSETEKIFGCERATGVRLTNGFSIAADLVVIAIGIRPNAELARAAGLRVRRGIVVGDDMRTSDPAIFAVGECVEHRGEVFGMVSALWDQARVCAAQLAGDARAAYRPPTPFTRLKIGGIEMFSAGALSAGDPSEAEIMFQDTERGVYRKVVLRDDKLIGAVLYGDVRDGPWYVDLMRQGIDIGEIRDDLVFGRVYDGRTVPTGVLVDRAPELAA
jgi:nitrite reductase (NADH) large subunit